MTPENAQVSVADAVRIAGCTQSQYKNWLGRHGLFNDRDLTGRGHHVPLGLREIMILAGIKKTVDAGVDVGFAVDGFDRYSVYGALFENCGEFVLAPNHDCTTLVGTDGTDVPVTIRVRLWPIFDQIMRAWFPERPDDPEFIAYMEFVTARRWQRDPWGKSFKVNTDPWGNEIAFDNDAVNRTAKTFLNASEIYAKRKADTSALAAAFAVTNARRNGRDQ